MQTFFISAIGQANYFDLNFFSECKIKDFSKIIAIDVGIIRDENNKLCGDISKDMYDYFQYATSSPGGIGLLTVLEVVRNLIKCGENN
ncbi:TPA: hypothetical protein ACH354_002360 [Clostridium perfringens]